MKIILALSGIVSRAVLIAAPALKKLNPIRLLTAVMLVIYSIGIIKMIFSFPISSFFSLGAGMMSVLCIAFLSRHRSVRVEMKTTEHKIRILNRRLNEVREEETGLTIINRLAVDNI